jgi:hypothetical protein
MDTSGAELLPMLPLLPSPCCIHADEDGSYARFVKKSSTVTTPRIVGFDVCRVGFTSALLLRPLVQ